MGLRRKTTIVICFSLVLLTVLMYLGLRHVLMNNVLVQENEDVREHMVRVINAIENEKRELQSLTSDYSRWDDSYNFVNDRNQVFIDSIMLDATFTNLKVNLIAYIDISGNIVYSKGYDHLSNSAMPVAESLKKEISSRSLLIQNPKSPHLVSGILILPERSMMICSSPITHSDGKGPIGGTLLMGRLIDNDYMRQLSETTQLNVVLYELNNINQIPEYRSAYEAIEQSRAFLVQMPSEEAAACYSVLDDVYGKPAMLAKILVPRDMFKRGNAIIYYAGLFVIIEGLLMGLLILYLMERMILSRILRLSKEIQLIGKTGFGVRVKQDSADELGQLAMAINNMLADLQATNLEIANILENISDSFISYDNDLRHTYINKAAERMLGVDREVLIGQTIEDKLHQLAPLVLEKYQQVLKERKARHFEVHFDFLDKWLELNVYPTQKGISVYFRDVSERKIKADMALRQSEELFFRAFHRNPIMMAILSAEQGTFVDANEVLLKTLGYTREEIIGHNVFNMNILRNNEATKKWGTVLLEKGKLENVEINFYTRKAELRRGLLWSYLFNSNGVPCHLAAVLDVTEQRRMQEEFERLDRLNLVGEIAASIAHEIRNPMTTVRGLLQMLNEQEEHFKNHPYYHLMIEELDRANTIISEFLSIAQNKAVDLKYKNLNSIVRALFPLIKADANYSGTEVRMELSEPPELLLDEGEIRQMILNLARNGLEAMPDGGLLKVGTYTDNNEVVLFISDEGKGLEPNLLDKLGTPFLTTKENGTGLGLAICYSIAAHHAARITVDTGARGTTFRVHFPAPDNDTLGPQD